VCKGVGDPVKRVKRISQPRIMNELIMFERMMPMEANYEIEQVLPMNEKVC